ncbi:hypothetical protein D515_00920 [Grimontia indica]|uniref:DUF3108 domain-containing protein n=1 Tax=Grimontia indica TaxID=1056512 RepID=R1IH96_9GAMM|nr:hypothetical protein [Grimontia indica]EOD80096.1 hypothetical protein D515_00920 [Grimontia indica]
MTFAKYGLFTLLALFLTGCEEIDRSVSSALCFNEALDKEGAEYTVDYIYRLKDSHNYSYGAGEKVVNGGEVSVPRMPGVKATQVFTYKRKKDKDGHFHTLSPDKPEEISFSTKDVFYGAIEENEDWYYFPSGVQGKDELFKGEKYESENIFKLFIDGVEQPEVEIETTVTFLGIEELDFNGHIFPACKRKTRFEGSFESGREFDLSYISYVGVGNGIPIELDVEERWEVVSFEITLNGEKIFPLSEGEGE